MVGSGLLQVWCNILHVLDLFATVIDVEPYIQAIFVFLRLKIAELHK